MIIIDILYFITQNLLLQDEFMPPSSDRDNENNAIEIEDAEFMWEQEEIKPERLQKQKKDDKWRRKYSSE